jgi:transposase
MNAAGGSPMKRFVQSDRSQVTLLPECLDDDISEDNPVRAIDLFTDRFDVIPFLLH